MTTDIHPRSLLFVPADQERRIVKSLSIPADIVILDLEDGVPAARKEIARTVLPQANSSLRNGGHNVWLRINAIDAGGAKDLAAASAAGIEAIMVPKVRSPDDIETISRIEGSRSFKFVALIEDALGVLNAPAIAQLNQVRALAFGSEDFSAATSIAPTLAGLALPAQLIVLAAAAAGLPAFGLAGSIADYKDIDAFRVTIENSSKLGFSGALCIHPAQVEIANIAFAPSAERIAEARAILAAAQAADGEPVAHMGKMIDAPIIARAERDVLMFDKIWESRHSR